MPDNIYIGIDPGKTGAIAVLDGDSINVFDIPICERPAGKSTKTRKTFHEIDLVALYLIFVNINKILVGDNYRLVIERMGARPTDTPHNAMDLGMTAGLIEGVAAGNELFATHKPLPQQWKKKMGLIGQDKEASRQKAIELFPTAEKYLKRKKDHNRAEALLLIAWAREVDNQ